MTRRLAIMLHHGLGDVVCALPGLWAADQALGAGGVMHLVVKSSLEAGLLRAVPWSSEVRLSCLHGGTGLARLLSTFRIALGLRMERPDAFLAPHVTSPLLAARMAQLVGAPISVAPGSGSGTGKLRLSPDVGEHKARYYARFLKAAGLRFDLDALAFPPLPDRAPDTGGLIRIILAPAVGAVLEQHKRWPEDRFAALADAIAARWPEARLELYGAPQERSILERVQALASARAQARMTLLTPATPALAAQSLSGAHCVVTSCSGASHLAAWADVPIVGVYGPTNPGFTGPFSGKLHVVRRALACSPCYRAEFISGCGTPVCMTGIRAADVLPAIAAAVTEQPPALMPVLHTTDARAPVLA